MDRPFVWVLCGYMRRSAGCVIYGVYIAFCVVLGRFLIARMFGTPGMRPLQCIHAAMHVVGAISNRPHVSGRPVYVPCGVYMA